MRRRRRRRGRKRRIRRYARTVIEIDFLERKKRTKIAKKKNI